MPDNSWLLNDSTPTGIAQEFAPPPAESDNTYWGAALLAFNDAEGAAALFADASASFALTSAAQAFELIAGASAASFAITSASQAAAIEAAQAAGQIPITSSAAAQALEQAAAAGAFAVTSLAGAIAPEQAGAAGAFSLVGESTATNPANLTADAYAEFVIQSITAAAAALEANAVGVIVMVGGYEEPAIPEYPTVTGMRWGALFGRVQGWRERYEKIKARRVEQPKPRLPLIAHAHADIVITSSATLIGENSARAVTNIRIVGRAEAVTDPAPYEDEELLVLAIMAELRAA